MSYVDKELARKLVMLEIQNRKEALELYDKIIPVIKKFDGKVLNKRLETALKAVDERLRVDGGYSSFRIEMRPKSNIVFSDKVDANGYRECAYVDDRELCLNTVLFTTLSYYDRKVMLDEDNRIIADVILEALKSGKKKMEENIADLEANFDKVEEFEKHLEELRKEMEDAMNEIPFLIRNYFGLNYHIRRE